MICKWRGRRFWNSGTDHFSSASGSTVWFVYPKVCVTTINVSTRYPVDGAAIRTIPCLIPFEPFHINKDTLYLDNRESRMRIIKLDIDLIRKLPPWSFRLFEPTNNIVEGGGNPEVLLLQSEFFPSVKTSR